MSVADQVRVLYRLGGVSLPAIACALGIDLMVAVRAVVEEIADSADHRADVRRLLGELDSAIDDRVREAEARAQRDAAALAVHVAEVERLLETIITIDRLTR